MEDQGKIDIVLDALGVHLVLERRARKRFDTSEKTEHNETKYQRMCNNSLKRYTKMDTIDVWCRRGAKRC